MILAEHLLICLILSLVAAKSVLVFSVGFLVLFFKTDSTKFRDKDF